MSTTFQERAWYTSSYTNVGQNDCVEVNYSRAGHGGVRDSKLGTASPVLAIPAAQWGGVPRNTTGGAGIQQLSSHVDGPPVGGFETPSNNRTLRA